MTLKSSFGVVPETNDLFVMNGTTVPVMIVFATTFPQWAAANVYSWFVAYRAVVI